MTLLELFKICKINIGHIIIERDSGELLNYEFEINAKDFLNYSKQDLKQKNERGNINALTNAKRAIDCQTDKILTCFGLDIKRRLPNSNNEYIRAINTDLISADLPHKLKLLQALSLTPASIIADARIIRNQLEHHYVKCSSKEAQHAIELADLFISATDNKLKAVWNYFISDIDGYNRQEGSRIDVFYNSKAKQIEVGGFSNNASYNLIITPEDMEFYALLKIAYSFDYDQDVEDYFKELMQVIKHPIPQAKIHVENV